MDAKKHLKIFWVGFTTVTRDLAAAMGALILGTLILFGPVILAQYFGSFWFLSGYVIHALCSFYYIGADQRNWRD